ncbi:MAG: glycosyltransferase, partial [candidate division WOR-3 bacterium]
MNLYFLLNSLAGGGAERVAVNLSKILPVKRFVLLEREIKYEIPEEKIVFLSSHTTKTNPILKTFYIPVYAKSLSQRLEKNSLVISFLERANYVNILAKLYSKHRAFISIHMSQLAGRKRHHPYNFLSKLLYPKADMVICVSKSIAKELKTQYKVPEDKLVVIYNPIFIDELKE